MLERGVLTDLNLFFKNMHFTAATRNYQDYKLPFNKAVRKRSEALVNSRSGAGGKIQVLEDEESEGDDADPDAMGVAAAGDPNHEK